MSDLVGNSEDRFMSYLVGNSEDWFMSDLGGTSKTGLCQIWAELRRPVYVLSGR